MILLFLNNKPFLRIFATLPEFSMIFLSELRAPPLFPLLDLCIFVWCIIKVGALINEIIPEFCQPLKCLQSALLLHFTKNFLPKSLRVPEFIPLLTKKSKIFSNLTKFSLFYFEKIPESTPPTKNWITLSHYAP